VVRAVFTGLAAIVVAIILNACISLSRTAVHEWQGGLLVALAFLDLFLLPKRLIASLRTA
jgi:chromate transport protein ChrA